MDKYEKAALAHANHVRRSLGQPPVEALVPGRMDEAQHCSLAKTIKKGWRGWRYVEVGALTAVALRPDQEEKLFVPSQNVRRFVCRFDNAKYPELSV